MGKKGSFQEHLKAPVSFQDRPEIGDVVWMDLTTGVIYNHDESRNRWLSANKTEFEFARRGSMEGMFIPLLGDLDDNNDAFTMGEGKDSVITSVFCKSTAGDYYKDFYIYLNGSPIFSFSYDHNLSYSNDSLNIPISGMDNVQVYVDKRGWKVYGTSCRIEVARRYDI